MSTSLYTGIGMLSSPLLISAHIKDFFAPETVDLATPFCRVTMPLSRHSDRNGSRQQAKHFHVLDTFFRRLSECKHMQIPLFFLCYALLGIRHLLEQGCPEVLANAAPTDTVRTCSAVHQLVLWNSFTAPQARCCASFLSLLIVEDPVVAPTTHHHPQDRVCAAGIAWGVLAHCAVFPVRSDPSSPRHRRSY